MKSSFVLVIKFICVAFICILAVAFVCSLSALHGQDASAPRTFAEQQLKLEVLTQEATAQAFVVALEAVHHLRDRIELDQKSFGQDPAMKPAITANLKWCDNAELIFSLQLETAKARLEKLRGK
jgi:hypothetical protein